MVLLPGIGMSHRYLARLHVELARNSRVASFDLPGFGGTRRPRGRMEVSDYAHVVASALEEWGGGPVTLVGHSMGTQFATEVARVRPDLVRRLVLMSPVVDERRRNLAQQALALGLDSVVESAGANAIVFSDYLRTGLRWYLKELPAMLGYPTDERLAHVRTHTLVLRGALDPVAGDRWCRTLASVAHGGRLVVVEGAAHVVQHTHTGQVAAAIRAFSRGETVGETV